MTDLSVPTEQERVFAIVTAALLERDNAEWSMPGHLIATDPDLMAVCGVFAGLTAKLVIELATQMEMDVEDFWRGVCERNRPDA